MKGYQYRWFVLNPESGKLEYFEVFTINIIKMCYISNLAAKLDFIGFCLGAGVGVASLSKTGA